MKHYYKKIKDKKITGQDLMEWKAACLFASDREASLAINVSNRTFARWKKTGIPDSTQAARAYRKVIEHRMRTILEFRLSELAKVTAYKVSRLGR